MPSVTIIEGSLKMVTKSPLKRPRAVPVPIATRNPTGHQISGKSRYIRPATIAEKPSIDPIERST